MEKIKGTFELVGATYHGLSKEDLITLVPAILSLVNLYLTYKINEKINASDKEFQKEINDKNNKLQEEINDNNNKFQEKLNQKNIDANLKSKARIKWIQDVRNTSSELLSIYYRLLNSTDKDKLLEIFITSQEKTELLILFFGPEKQNQEKVKQIDIKSHESNEGKNDLIVEFLDDLNKGFYTYCNNVLKDKKSNLEKIRESRLEEMNNHIIGYEEFDGIELGDGIGTVEVPVYDPDYEKKVDEIEEQIKENKNLPSNLNKKLIELRDIIRVYLKIEWNKSKNGE